MTNIFLSTSLLHLAKVASGCDLESDTCSNTIYGFRPSSLISIIAVVSGVLSALIMPITGAIVDFTSYRKSLGILSAALIAAIQVVHIGTVQKTWFVMAILQAIAGFLYQVQVLATYAYLPDIGRLIDDKKMATFTSRFTMIQFTAQMLFLIVVIALSISLKLGNTSTAQVSQGIDSAIIIIGFPTAWRMFPSVPQKHKLPEGKSIVTAGFIQNWKTFVGINQHYKSLRWFLISCVFAAAGADAFTTVSISFLSEVLKFNGTEVGIVFLIALAGTIPGAKFASIISQKTNPVTSYKGTLLFFSVVTVAGSFVLQGPEMRNVAFCFAFLWGVCLGMFYPTANLIFALSLPKGQESELTGFWIYASQIIVWLPPLIFTLMNESGIHMKYGLMSLIIFFIIGFLFLFLMEPWSKIREEAQQQSKMILSGQESS